MEMMRKTEKGRDTGDVKIVSQSEKKRGREQKATIRKKESKKENNMRRRRRMEVQLPCNEAGSMNEAYECSTGHSNAPE